MPQQYPHLLLTLCTVSVALCGQTTVQPDMPGAQSAVARPGTGESTRHDGFLKRFSVETFGYSLAPTGTGFESGASLTSGPFTSHGMDCPHCIIRSTAERGRFTLPPFGAEATMNLAGGRAQLFGGFGGINAWQPDNTLLGSTNRGTFHRYSSLNDAWLVQSWIGGRVAADRGKRLWLGVSDHYVVNAAPVSQTNWNTFKGDATFVFGH